jgi:2-phospho-L-lactate/phosphoenolpyruvate guanylyltransferase
VTFTVLVPLKATTRGKSRLALPADDRRALAIAMARDTLAAVAGCPLVERVVILVEEPADAVALDAPLGKFRLGDRLPGAVRVEARLVDVDGLNESLKSALDAPDLHGPTAVLLADLPFLTSADLASVLTCTAPAVVVADRSGTGTTLLTAPTPAQLRPAFGAGSFRRHLRDGAVPILLERDHPLRRDVDIVADLDGWDSGTVGLATRAVLSELAGRESAQVTLLP